ncbi:MAG: hypothetical protein ACLFVB_08230 [Thermoplasmata archaeon]
MTKLKNYKYCQNCGIPISIDLKKGGTEEDVGIKLHVSMRSFSESSRRTKKVIKYESK